MHVHKPGIADVVLGFYVPLTEPRDYLARRLLSSRTMAL
jgi:hypothetical protein